LITVSRALAKRLVSLLSKTFILPRNLLKRQSVKFIVNQSGLTIESATINQAIRYRDPNFRGLPQEWSAPLEAVQALAKSRARSGGYFLRGQGEVALHLVEDSIARDEGFLMPDLAWDAPPSPEIGYILPLTARKTLIAAFETTDSREPGRYALNRIQLQGSKGAVAATDGRQLLIQTGLQWPFGEDILLANYRRLFACGDFPEGPIEFSKTERHLVFRTGAWEFFLPIEESQKYPDVTQVIPNEAETVATLEISNGDAKYLREMLPILPFDFGDERPVTIELNGKIGVRGASMKNPAGVEVVLRNSQCNGVDLLCAMQRGYLRRALDLGLRRFQFFESGCAPIVVRKEDTTYCWATYDKNAVVKGCATTEVRESPLEEMPVGLSTNKLKRRKYRSNVTGTERRLMQKKITSRSRIGRRQLSA
jgi:hypothetical protein